ncbi:GAF domain-containing sensor histidine kinase [Pedobacter sp. MC2016-15]|uniref:GAF domain-containing sensor histidine kinase n=1 Tax=Pedobacter sp. MC2016-15 TaxID=2994473 RepID=UPI0022479AC6|nr:GAF domain-containing sensor histidine kinase [Pedobacter sp. MC2016-15]MCX2480105.1 GAF domain-containing sensor histidine kinase [Pedobacter sp. MC2016-15]
MTNKPLPLPDNEIERVFSLAEFDVDYSNMEDQFKDLTTLAANIAGTKISLVNLIDSFTQWTVANHGLRTGQTPRENSICQYTITVDDHFEIPDLTLDERFKEKEYVTGPLQLKYYFGVPVSTPEGHHIGALCVIDEEQKSLSPEKIELLKLVASEVANRLTALKTIDTLKKSLAESRELQKKIAHEIRGPLAGIIGLSGLIADQGSESTIDDILEAAAQINSSSKEMLSATNEITSDIEIEPLKKEEFNLHIFKDKLERLYIPQAVSKGIELEVNVSERTKFVPFLKNKMLQIAGNMINCALNCTSEMGLITVDLEVKPEPTFNLLKIKVTDSGSGMSDTAVDQLLLGQETEASDQCHDKSGLLLVKRLTNDLKGEFKLRSIDGSGTIAEVILNQTYV